MAKTNWTHKSVSADSQSLRMQRRQQGTESDLFDFALVAFTVIAPSHG